MARLIEATSSGSGQSECGLHVVYRSLTAQRIVWLIVSTCYFLYRARGKPTFTLEAFSIGENDLWAILFVVAFVSTRRRMYLVYAINPLRNLLLLAMQAATIDPPRINSSAFTEEAPEAEFKRDIASAAIQLGSGLVIACGLAAHAKNICIDWSSPTLGSTLPGWCCVVCRRCQGHHGHMPLEQEQQHHHHQQQQQQQEKEEEQDDKRLAAPAALPQDDDDDEIDPEDPARAIGGRGGAGDRQSLLLGVWLRVGASLSTCWGKTKFAVAVILLLQTVGLTLFAMNTHTCGFSSLTTRNHGYKVVLSILLGVSEEVSWREAYMGDSDNLLQAFVWGMNHLVVGEGMSSPVLYGLVSFLYAFILGMCDSKVIRYGSHAAIEYFVISNLVKESPLPCA